MIDQQVSYDIYTPFGPKILKSSVPQLIVDAINKEADGILTDEKKRKDHDYSHNLAGNIKYECALPLHKVPSLELLINKLSSEYVTKTVKDYVDMEKTAMSYSAWVVSQYAGDFNPIHIHDANLSGVCFLKLPPGYDEEYRREDHHPSIGCLEFLGSVPNHFASHSYLVKPELGDIYVFPSWLSHQVYPFRSKGERRSMSFNIHLRSKDGQPKKGVDV
jgi:uncharacterized protein (TIGR02466 family)|tara:strand:- start:326 stop:979 length:654 start_codon:yes stop_codon:yes gene_type:complete